MAIKWSWAFGPEEKTQYQEMGWTVEDSNALTASTEYTYTYTGSPARHSLAMDDNYSELWPPAGCIPPEGWVSIATYVSGTHHAGEYPIKVYGASSNRFTGIQMKVQATNTFALYVDNVEKATFVMGPNDWQYLSLQYSMTGTTWSGRAYVNGTAVTAEYTDAQSAETAASCQFHGFANGDKETFLAQIIVHDSKADSGSVPRYCTRIQPTVDTATTGTWTPNVGTSDFAVLSGSWNSATFTENSGSTVGDNCRVQAQNLATQLGVTPTSIDGITVHAWATGSGQNGFTAISDNDTNYDNGSTITPDTNDPTYAFSTAADQPSNAAVWNVTSSVFFKYEVS
jgi:hypothetical protein